MISLLLIGTLMTDLEVTNGLVRKQDAAATAFFSTYSDGINYYLVNVFKTHFRIENLVHIPPQGMAAQSKRGYRITIDGQDISIDSRQGNSFKRMS